MFLHCTYQSFSFFRRVDVSFYPRPDPSPIFVKVKVAPPIPLSAQTHAHLHRYHCIPPAVSRLCSRGGGEIPSGGGQKGKDGGLRHCEYPLYTIVLPCAQREDKKRGAFGRWRVGLGRSGVPFSIFGGMHFLSSSSEHKKSSSPPPQLLKKVLTARNPASTGRKFWSGDATASIAWIFSSCFVEGETGKRRVDGSNVGEIHVCLPNRKVFPWCDQDWKENLLCDPEKHLTKTAKREKGQAGRTFFGESQGWQKI